MSRVPLTALGLALLAAPARAEGGEGGLFFPIFNFVLLLAVLFYFARKPAQKFFHDRRAGIQDALHAAAELRREAEERYAQWQGKLVDVETELAEIRETSRRRAESERDHIIAEANAVAERIRQDASAAIQQELRRSRDILRDEAADLAIEMAENLLREQVTDADRERLVSEFIERVESRAGAAGARS